MWLSRRILNKQEKRRWLRNVRAKSQTKCLAFLCVFFLQQGKIKRARTRTRREKNKKSCNRSVFGAENCANNPKVYLTGNEQCYGPMETNSLLFFGFILWPKEERKKSIEKNMNLLIFTGIGILFHVSSLSIFVQWMLYNNCICFVFVLFLAPRTPFCMLHGTRAKLCFLKLLRVPVDAYGLFAWIERTLLYGFGWENENVSKTKNHCVQMK